MTNEQLEAEVNRIAELDQKRIEAFYTKCHFTKCRWLPVKLIGQAAWGAWLVEFPDGTREMRMPDNLRETK